MITVADDIPQMGVNAKGILYVKLGMDGASSQSNCNQKYDEADLAERSSNEESLFLTSITTLRLVINSKEVWSNPKTSSQHFTRPLHMQYEKENVELTVREEQCLRGEIDSLTDFNFEFGSISINAEITMLDGKAVNAITNTKSSQSCHICAASPKEMNNLQLVRKKVIDEKAVKLGLSPLHMLMRGFEYILHLGYKMENQTFFARSPEEKASVEKRKMLIKKRFREELSLLVHTPKQGFANTNTGNTARRAFDNPEVFPTLRQLMLKS